MAGFRPLAAVVVLGLLVLVQQTTSLMITHPVPNLEKARPGFRPLIGPFFGVVLATSTNEKALNNSGKFDRYYHVDIAGRRFHVGMLDGAQIVYVLSGSQTTNTAVATQLLLDYFSIRGIVHVGGALSLDSSFTLGSVGILKSYAFTGYWTWLPEILRRSSTDGKKALTFADFNYDPTNGRNSLGSIKYEPIKVFKPEYVSPVNTSFLHTVDEYFYDIAEGGIKDVELETCYNSVCLPTKPEVVFGLKGSSSDIYIENKAYAKFLRRTFGFSTADIQTATVLLTSKANGVPAIAFKSASSSLSAEYDSSYTYIAAENALLVATKFVKLFPVPRAETY